MNFFIQTTPEKKKSDCTPSIHQPVSLRNRYHIECQRTEDGTMIIRMFEYDTHLAAKYQKVAKEVSRQMGGKVLNYEAKDILNRGREEGFRKGEASGLAKGIKEAKMQLAAKLLKNGNSVRDTADLTELPTETVAELARTISSES